MFTNILHPWDDVLDLLMIFAGLAFVISYAWGQWQKGRTTADLDTIKTYQAELEIVKQSLERLREELRTKDQQISSLQGQINVLKEVPLVNIDTTLREISRFNKNLFEINTKILERLNSDAVILSKEKKK